MDLVERYECVRNERPQEPSAYNARRAKPAYSAPAVLAPDGSWDFGPSPDANWDFAPGGSTGAPPLATAAAAASVPSSDDTRSHPMIPAPLGRIAPPPAFPGSPAQEPDIGQRLSPSHQMAHHSASSSRSDVGRGGVCRCGSSAGCDPTGSSSGSSSSRGGSMRSRHRSIGASHSSRSTDSGKSSAPGQTSSAPSCVPLVVAPVLARMLGVHQDKQIQKAIAQLKLAFDNLEKQRPALSRDVLTQVLAITCQKFIIA